MILCGNTRVCVLIIVGTARSTQVLGVLCLSALFCLPTKAWRWHAVTIAGLLKQDCILLSVVEVREKIAAPHSHKSCARHRIENFQQKHHDGCQFHCCCVRGIAHSTSEVPNAFTTKLFAATTGHLVGARLTQKNPSSTRSGTTALLVIHGSVLKIVCFVQEKRSRC